MTLTKFIITFLLFTFIATSLFAQHAVWVSRYNGPVNSDDRATSIAVDDFGNVFVTGYSPGNGTGKDCATIKYNPLGVQQWVQRYNGPGNGDDIPNSIGVDDSGNVYIAGSSMGSGTGWDYLTIKYNSAGVQQWVQRYHGSANWDDELNSMTVDSMGNVHVTGYSKYNNNINLKYVTIKYNSAGVQQWKKDRYLLWNESIAHSIGLDSSGNVYITGETGGGYDTLLSQNSDICTIKYDSSGGEKWFSIWGSGNYSVDRGLAIAVDKSGNSYVIGSTSPAPGYTWPILLKYNTMGNLMWQVFYELLFKFMSEIKVDNLGHAYATGRYYSAAPHNYVTGKFGDTPPSVVWLRYYNGPGNNEDLAYSIAVDDSSFVYVTGKSIGVGTGFDYATVKYDSAGVQQWVSRYNGPVNGGDDASSIAVDNLGNVFVTGYSAGDRTSNDYATIKYSPNLSPLYPFNLSSPPNGTRIITSTYNDTLLHMQWTRSGYGTTYKWIFGSPTIANPVLVYEANECGYDSVFSIRKDSLDAALERIGVLTGDSIIGEWAVWAFNGVDSLKSAQTWSMILRRSPIVTLFYDPFMSGTGKWTITNDGGTCVWEIFSAPYLYTLPYPSVSPVLSADATSCGPRTKTKTTTTVANNINCSGYNNITLEFDNDWKAHPFYPNSALVEASYNGGTTWTTIISWGLNSVRNTHEIKSLSGAENIPNLKVRFRVRLESTVLMGIWWTIDNVTIKGDLLTGVTKNKSIIPKTYALSQNYPNPFNPSTKIKFDIPKSSYVKLIVYDVLGREIKTLVNEKLNAGRYDVNWDGSDYSSGVYIYKMEAGDFVNVKKMVLVK